MQRIEFVCTGNHGRSPVAELIANKHLRNIGQDGLYQAISSGSHVAALDQGEIAREFMLRIIDIGKQRGLYQPEQLAEIDKALRDGNDKALMQFYQTAAKQYRREEAEQRAEAIEHFGIEGKVKPVREQTIARPDVVVLLGMTEKHRKKAASLYDGTGFTPLIQILSQYATRDPKAELFDAFGLGKDAYFKTIEMLLNQVPKAIDRLLEERA